MTTQRFRVALPARITEERDEPCFPFVICKTRSSRVHDAPSQPRARRPSRAARRSRPGGLRDLQRALAVNSLASGRPTALAEPTLVEAHRFLWLVRCHLHLLVGRAEDRLRLALQPAVARRLGFDEPRETTGVPYLLHLFRRHAHNVLQTAGLATASGPAQGPKALA